MVLQDYKIDDNKIIITKEELQEIKEHYLNVADKYKSKNNNDVIDVRYPYYIGKAAVLIDILKMFEPIDFI